LFLFLAHHGEAVGPEVDPQRPLSSRGRGQVERLAAQAAARGARPAVVWHSGKLRTRQTAEAYWRACNALADMSATRDLQPDDPPEWIRDRLLDETRDVLVAGHFPHLQRLLTVLLTGRSEPVLTFPQHGIVALVSKDGGQSWSEEWRVTAEDAEDAEKS
jgi:phosphohistidine phosphatase